MADKLALPPGVVIRDGRFCQETPVAGEVADADTLDEIVDALQAALAEALGLLEHRVTWSDMPRDALRDKIDLARIAELRAKFLG